MSGPPNAKYEPAIGHLTWRALTPADAKKWPTVGGAAIAIAKQRARLEGAGWRVLTCDADVIEELDNKVRLRGRAERLGLLEFLPAHYETMDAARYPCVVKLPTGEYGKTVRLAKTPRDVPAIFDEFRIDEDQIGDKFLCQEHLPGSGQQQRAKFPTSKAPISAVFHSFRLIFGRAIIPRSALDAWMLFPERARAEYSR